MASAAGQPVTFSLKFQSRALTAVQSNKFISTWIVGTNSLREENEVRIMQYDADNERLVCAKALTHAPEIWDIAACPSSDELIITVWSQGGNYSATLWSTNSTSAVERITDLPGHTGLIRRALWHATQAELAVTIEEGALHTWSVSNQGASCTASQQAGELLQLWSGQLSPHDTHTCATAGGNNIQMWDLRSMQLTSEIQAAHRMPTRDVCFSPASEHRLVSCGDDCKLRIWDLRLLGKGESLLELGGHSHWVWWAQYCPFHEQLIASASSDTLVNLYHAPHVASTDPAGGAAEGMASTADVGAAAAAPGGKKSVPSTPTRGGDLDGKVRTYDEHEDSVYGLAWSSADPWLFASLSYDGRMVVNKVPKNTKYKVIV